MSGGLEFKGRPTMVYQDWLESCEAQCLKLAQDRKSNDKQYNVSRIGRVTVDYDKGHVAAQLWPFLKPRLKAVFKEGGVAKCVHSALTEAMDTVFQTVPQDSLEAFTAQVGSLLKVDADAYQTMDEDVDVDASGLAETTEHCPKKDLAVSLAQLAMLLPPTDAESICAAPAPLDVCPDEELLYLGEVAGIAAEPDTVQATIRTLMAKFIHPKSIEDVVEAAIELSTVAMPSKEVRASLPDRQHASILQRWMTVSKTMGPQGATELDEETVKKDDEFWPRMDTGGLLAASASTTTDGLL